MNKVEELIAATRLSELMNKKEEEDKNCKTLLWVLAIMGAVAGIAAIAYAVYCFFTPDYLEDFEEDFEDDFDDDLEDSAEEVETSERGYVSLISEEEKEGADTPETEKVNMS